MKRLKEDLIRLKEEHSLVGIKGGTEVEGMTFEEIYFMKEVSNNVVPMTVKIGGPEARNDIDYMLSIRIDKILAPMIESAYSMKNFVDTIDELNKNRMSNLAINIETITAYNNLESIVRSPYFLRIDQITVGRSDFAGSLNRDVDDAKVTQYSRDVIEQSKYYDKLTSVGGKINPINALMVKEHINPDMINTRHMVVSCDSNNLSSDVEAALTWEKKFYQYLSKIFPSRANIYKERITSIISRLNEKVMI